METLSIDIPQSNLDHIKIPICRSIKQNNDVFKSNQKMGLPFFAIKAGRKYGKLEYDFITINKNLNIEAAQKVNEIYIQMANESPLYKWPILVNTGRIYGVSPRVDLDICKEYALIAQEIIFNPNNWE